MEVSRSIPVFAKVTEHRAAVNHGTGGRWVLLPVSQTFDGQGREAAGTDRWGCCDKHHLPHSRMAPLPPAPRCPQERLGEGFSICLPSQNQTCVPSLADGKNFPPL